ncbi:MAG: sugar phosphate nucleotidyltransferase [Patescibacteria group bacterium]
MKIVIRAGGVGTRLWPISRENKPKQLHALLSSKTMLQEAIEKALKVCAPQDIFVSGNINSERVIRKDLGAVIENNLIIEPARRDTAAAIGLESIYISQADPKAIVASLGSDHAIKNEAEFVRLLKLGEKTIQANPQNILCLGIKPKYPDTGFGYIELNETVVPEVYTVKSFHEKPNVDKAIEFVEAGNYLWNANMFIWRVDTILDLYAKYLPDMYGKLMEIKNVIGTDQEKNILEKIYPELEKIAVDYAIIEKASNILAIPADIGWNDIGDWARLKEQLSLQEADNIIKANHIGLDTKNTLVYSETDKLIATIGLENIIIVETDDALLVCDKYSSPQVKKIVDMLKEDKKNKYL